MLFTIYVAQDSSGQYLQQKLSLGNLNIRVLSLIYTNESGMSPEKHSF